MKKKTIATMSALFLSFCGANSIALAEEVKEDVENNIFTLGEIVVEDSSGVQDIAITNTVTEETIKAVGATTAAEALRYVPGINVVQTTKGELNINMQGFSQKDILVLIDGVPYYETQNGPLDLQQIPASIIGKIEVTKGASSVLYGPNALGGVVNIITKKGVEGFEGSVSGELGSGEFGRGVATLNYGHENGFSILGTVDYKTRDSLSFSDDYEPNASSVKGMGKKTYIVDEGGDKDNSDLESLNLWTRLGYAPSDNVEMYTSLYRFEMERGRLFSDNHNKRFYESKKGAAFSTFGRYDSYEDMGIDFGGKVKTNDWLTVRAMAFYHEHEDDYVSYEDWTLNKALATSTWDDKSYGASIFTDMDLEQYGNLSLSAQYREDEHKQRGDVDYPWNDSNSSILTFAAEDTVTFGSVTAVAGLAYHYFDAEKIADEPGYDTDTFDPMIGLTWTTKCGAELFGSIARKTRFPVFNDMEYDNNFFTLDPEQNINYTLGTNYTFFGKSDMSLSAFYNDVTDRIAEATDAAGNDIMTNLDEVEIYGAEFTSDTALTPRVRLRLDYVYTNARNTSDNRESDYLEDVPEHQGIVAVSYLIPVIETAFNIGGNLKLDNVVNNEDDVMEDSFVVDLSLIKDFDNGFTLGGYVYNLLDENFYEGDGMASNGISFKVLGQYNF